MPVKPSLSLPLGAQGEEQGQDGLKSHLQLLALSSRGTVNYRHRAHLRVLGTLNNLQFLHFFSYKEFGS